MGGSFSSSPYRRKESKSSHNQQVLEHTRDPTVSRILPDVLISAFSVVFLPPRILLFKEQMNVFTV